MAEWSYIERAFFAGVRYGYKRGYRDAEAETRRQIEGLMDEMRTEIAATRGLPALNEIDEDVDIAERDSKLPN